MPIGLEGSRGSLEPLLASVVAPGRGLEIVSRVRGIPRGSRLAVSTNLLASLIALGVCLKSWSTMRRRSPGLRWLLAARCLPLSPKVQV